MLCQSLMQLFANSLLLFFSHFQDHFFKASFFRDIMKQPEVVSSLEKQGLSINFLPGPQLTALMRRDQERWGKVVKEQGLKGE